MSKDQLQEVKYPNIVVQLVGNNGNAYAILGAVRTALKKAKVSKDDIEKLKLLFLPETNQQYDHLSWKGIEKTHMTGILGA